MQSRKNSNPNKTDLLNLISQSFQTNLNILSYLEKSGLQFDNNDWNQLLKTQNNTQDQSPILAIPNQIQEKQEKQEKKEDVRLQPTINVKKDEIVLPNFPITGSLTIRSNY